MNNNTSSWSLVIGLFLAVFMSSYSAAQVQSSASLPNRQELTKSKRLKIVATVKKAVSKDSLILDWSVRNVSRKDVSFRDTYVLRDYSFVVKDQKGAIVEPTKEGRQKIFESSFVSHRSPVTVHPGDQIERQLVITDIYGFRQGEFYKIYVQRQMSFDGGKTFEEVRSNIVSAKVGG